MKGHMETQIIILFLLMKFLKIKKDDVTVIKQHIFSTLKYCSMYLLVETVSLTICLFLIYTFKWIFS